MTDTHDTNDIQTIMERELKSLTQYGGEPTELWKQAIEEVEAKGATADATRTNGRQRWRFMNQPLSRRFWMPGVAVAAMLVLFVSVGLPNLGKARSSASAGMPMLVIPQAELSDVETPRSFSLNYSSADTVARALGGRSAPGGPNPLIFAQHSTSPSDGNDMPQATGRSVIRNVTMELRTPDVAATFLRARQLVSRAGGEFIEDSSLTGEGDAARANLTLRIAPDRLSDVLNELRTLGVVASEQARSEDVTNQVVDLETRLRNEQRVEEELLELLESREDADLSEILKLQSEIGRVRTNIEHFIAQRDQISRLVSLATILVIIRPEAIEPEKPKEASMWDDFKGSVNDSWEGGVAFLSNTIAGLVGLLVGGLVWWIALIAAGLMIRRYVRTLPEPAP